MSPESTGPRCAGAAMLDASGVLASAFPPPPPDLATALDELRLAAAMPPETKHELRWVAMLPRPWDPPSCPPELRQVIYVWLDDVAGWINEEHTWRVDRVIPMCWDLHPHIVHELATVACMRWEAGFAVTPSALEEWHRYTLPMFLERVTKRIGATGCPPGRHQPNPGAARNALYRHGDETGRRRRRHWQDMEQQPDHWIAARRSG